MAKPIIWLGSILGATLTKAEATQKADFHFAAMQIPAQRGHLHSNHKDADGGFWAAEPKTCRTGMFSRVVVSVVVAATGHHLLEGVGRGAHLRRREASCTRRTVGQHDQALRRAAPAGRGGVGHAPVAVEEEVADGRRDGWREPIRSLGGAGQVPGKSKGGDKRPSVERT